MIVLLRCPTWKLFAIFGEEYSMMTFLPAPEVFVPYEGSGMELGELGEGAVEGWERV